MYKVEVINEKSPFRNMIQLQKKPLLLTCLILLSSILSAASILKMIYAKEKSFMSCLASGFFASCGITSIIICCLSPSTRIVNSFKGYTRVMMIKSSNFLSRVYEMMIIIISLLILINLVTLVGYTFSDSKLDPQIELDLKSQIKSLTLSLGFFTLIFLVNSSFGQEFLFVPLHQETIIIRVSPPDEKSTRRRY